MKELRIPVPSDQAVDLSAITQDFKGIIIGYKGDKPIGYVQYSDGDWYFVVDIDSEGSICDEGNLLELIEYLIRQNICNHFKVLEFVKC